MTEKQPKKPTLVILESPYAGDITANAEYARAAMLDSLNRGEAPMASHFLYTQVLDDTDPGQRHTGIEAGLAWGRAAELTVVYIDRGISAGMIYGIENAQKAGRKILYRRLKQNHETEKTKHSSQLHEDAERVCNESAKLHAEANESIWNGIAEKLRNHSEQPDEISYSNEAGETVTRRLRSWPMERKDRDPG